MLFRYHFKGFLLSATLLMAPFQGLAQQPATPPVPLATLEQVLNGVLNNFATYLSTVPNLYADEHLVSSSSGMGIGAVGAQGGLFGNRISSSTTDSIFRLKRGDARGKVPQLIESRQIQSVNHRPPAPDQTLTGPVFFSGGFSYAASFLSPVLEPCYVYRLQHNQRLHGSTVLVVDYTSKQFLSRDAKCPVSEQHSGRVFLDPASLQIVRLEQVRPRHDISQEISGEFRQFLDGVPKLTGMGGASVPQQENGQGKELTATWAWSIDYAQVTLNGRTFWLPKTITSKTSTNDGPQVHWSFAASYSNYHLMDVHSTILPGIEYDPKP